MGKEHKVSQINWLESDKRQLEEFELSEKEIRDNEREIIEFGELVIDRIPTIIVVVLLAAATVGCFLAIALF